MSKFFRGAVSSSDSSSSESTDEEIVAPAKHRVSFAYLSDSEDEGQKRVVKAEKDRRLDELKDFIRQAKNSKNIKDMSKLLTTFEEICKVFEKTRVVLAREGISVPRFYIRFLSETEDFVNEQWEDKEARKTLSKVNSKGLTTLRQKIRKYNKELEAEVTAYRAEPDPVGYSSGDDEVEDDKTDGQKNAELEVRDKVEEQHDNASLDSDDWSSDTDKSSESDSELDFEGKRMEDLRKFFLKKEFKEGGEAEGKEKRQAERAQRQKEREAKEKLVDKAADEEWVSVPTKEEKTRQLFKPNTEITHKVVLDKLDEILQVRGRKSTNRKHYVCMLEELYNVALEHKLGGGMLAKILISVISALSELSIHMSECMDYTRWSRIVGVVGGLFDLLNDNPQMILSLNVEEDNENVSNADQPYKVHGSALMNVHLLDSEFTKILQNADYYSTDYVDKLKGEKELCALIDKSVDYVGQRIDDGIFTQEEICKLYMLKIEHLYYKYEPKDAMESCEESGAVTIERLCKEVYARDETKRLRQRAILCQIYHLALHDHWNKAKELMLMSHLQSTIEHSDISTQILYNRAICQLGLCAFRRGLITEAHHGLSEIQNTQRARELLAQGVPVRPVEQRTFEQDKLDRARLIPYHMHINVDVIECVYLICSMLLEIPRVASQQHEMRRKLLSRSFHYHLKQLERNSVIGPPESTREHIVAASRALLDGDWKKCRDFIINDKMNVKIWSLFRNADDVKRMLVEQIQVESLRAYLFTYSTVYTSVSLGMLKELFELDKPTIISIITKAIALGELNADVDESSDCLIMVRTEPTPLDLLSLNYLEKISQLADLSEQVFERREGRGHQGSGSRYTRQQRTNGDEKVRNERHF
uniref:Eukaryotic translation initiation factor 3 subunit C n=1 Tax=Ascaris suum TaxID=6253 RepID=F1KV38_ASCSU